MARPDPRKLRAEAQDLAARGKLGKAIEAYHALETLEPGEGAHPHKLGELLHKDGAAGPAVLAWVRAADRYARAGFLVKAIAVCKLILRVDPNHREAQERIAGLNQERGLAAPAAPREAEAAARALSAGRGLDAVSLGGLAGGSSTEVAPGLDEIELDDFDIEEDYGGPGLGTADRSRIHAALGATPFVAALGGGALARLIDAAALVELGPGDVLFRQGDPGDTLYVVEHGAVAASVDGPPRRELGRLGEGAVFGEIALLTDQPRSATITALQPTRLVAFDRKAVGETLAAEPRATAVLVDFLRQRLLANLVASSPMFAPFTPEERRQLVARFRLCEAAPGAVVVAEGQLARGLYVVLAGSAEVVRGDAAVPIATLAGGDVFGEISLLEGEAVATVRARSRCLLLVLPTAEFREVIMTHPRVLEYVAELADARKTALATADPAAADLGVDLHLDFV
jgi:cAMP-dependent protein kinase regulator